MAADGFIDYRKSVASDTLAPDETLDEKAAKKSGRKRGGKSVEEYDRRDLEEAARDNHDAPVGTLVGDRRAASRGEDGEGYLGGGVDPFGSVRSDGSVTAYTTNEQDIGHSRFNTEDDSYYAPRKAFNKQHEPQSLGYDPSDRHFLHDHTIPIYPTQGFLRRCILNGFQIGSFLITLMSFNILVVVAIVTHLGKKMNPFHKEPPRGQVEKEWEQRISGERFSSRAEYYANFFGYECEDIDVETQDGFVLRLHHLTSKKHKALGHPVILQHGILSNSVTFMVNEERSLAFWLLEQGYDVYCSNIRTNFKMPHRHFPRSDPRYWAWAIKEIGIYDLPAIIDYVHKRTELKPAYIGHSQGTGTMFLALSRGMRPDMGNKISSFIALGPAVYAGPVFRHFPFSLMRRFRARAIWSFIFGVREFIPVISILQGVLPGWLFGHLAFPVFAFIFGFHDHNWLNRQIPKFFRTVAVATSSELLYYYMSNLSHNNCIFDTTQLEPWFPASFPPLAIFYGTRDTLVIGKPLVERIRSSEPNVRLLKAVALEDYEHLDMVWGVNAVKDCFYGIRDVIEETKNGFAPVGVEQPRRTKSRNSSRRG